MSVKAADIFIIKSRLGLFLPLNTWETLDLCTPIFSANCDADKLLFSRISNNLIVKSSMYTFVNLRILFEK